MINWDNVEFKNEKRFLSNMFPIKIKFESTIQTKLGVINLNELFPLLTFDNEIYNSSEHIYQAMKTENKEFHTLIRNIEEPTKTKSFARKNIVLENDLFSGEFTFKLRENWDEYKLELMEAILLLKFAQNKDLREKLFKEKGLIEERNDWKDKFWGTYLGEGENHLGLILMKVRDYLKNFFH